MAVWQYLQRNIYNFYLEIRHCRKQFILCLILLVLGIVIGCFLHNGAAATMWHTNRQGYVVLVVYNGSFFSVLFSAIFRAAIFAAVLFLFSLLPRFNVLKCLVPFVSGIYLGIYLCFAVEMFGLLGFIYFLLVFLVESLILTLAVILSYCDCDHLCPCGRRFFSNIFYCNKRALIMLAVGCLVKMFVVFVILRIFTSLI